MKFHSSIFSFDTLQGNPLRLLVRPTVAIVLILFLTAELAVRVTIPEGRIPKGGFHNAEQRQSVEQLEQLQAIDLMVTGSSIAAANFTPDTFDPQMQSLGFDDFTSFNGGIRGCNYSCIAPSVEKLFLSRRSPSILLMILSPNDVDASSPNVITRSKEHVKTLNQPNYRKIALNALSTTSWVYGFDAEIRTLLSTGSWKFDPANITVRGHIDMGSTLRKKHTWDYQIDVDGPIPQALYSLVERLTQRGISVIVIPVVGESGTRSNFRPSDRQDFNAVIERLMINKLVKVVRVDESHPNDEQYIDNVHLKSKSARSYSRQIADWLVDDGFPWDIKLANKGLR